MRHCPLVSPLNTRNELAFGNSIYFLQEEHIIQALFGF